MRKAKNFVVVVKRSKGKNLKLPDRTQQRATVEQVVAAQQAEAKRPLLKMPRFG